MKTSLKRTLTGRRRTVAAVVAATVVLGGAGATTAMAFADDHNHDAVTARVAGAKQDDSALAKSTGVDLKQAVDAALKSVQGTVTSVDLDKEQGKAAWEVEIVDANGAEHEVTVDAQTGKVTVAQAHKDDEGDDTKRGKSDDGSEEAALAKAAKTDVKAAADAALKSVQGTATSAELGNDDGKATVWEVEIVDANGAEHEVTVDAQTGKVTATKADED
ncbi:PepSY domain-containing protein, partial [Streptomyces sp. NPDC056231]|uniref:PepSY domain-containing protein n=1 Tax=Streptomyces sp. NPDC056231 TaxID=3345755 RepID=UPI003AAA9A27